MKKPAPTIDSALRALALVEKPPAKLTNALAARLAAIKEASIRAAAGMAFAPVE